jgi:hypothetical protein
MKDIHQDLPHISGPTRRFIMLNASASQELEQRFKTAYAYQSELKDSPLIQAWLTRVNEALAAMTGVDVDFATSLQDRSEINKPYHDHDNQPIVAFLPPVIVSTEPDALMDEECLPYYRVRFADGVELIADDSELFSFDPKFFALVNAVSGAFSCAREMDFVGPWQLAAEGTEEQKATFMEAFAARQETTPTSHWLANFHTPPKYRAIL